MDPLPPQITALEKILADAPAEVKAEILTIVMNAGITSKEDVLYQIVQVLGIYSQYFEKIPDKMAAAIEVRLERLEILSTHIQKVSGEDYQQLKDEGEALITSLQEFVILTQSVKVETNAALDRTSKHLQELAEKFSKELKEKIISQVLDELLEKVRSTLDESKKALNEALKNNRKAAEEIERGTSEMLMLQRSQMEETYEFNVQKARTYYNAVSILWGIITALVISTGMWYIVNWKYTADLVTAKENWQAEKESLWATETKDMPGNKNILRKLAENDIILKYVQKNNKSYLVVPGGPSTETEAGTYIEVAIDPKKEQID